MYKVIDFIRWALTHVKAVPEGADLPLAAELCGSEPWHYLFGSVRVPTTRAVINSYWDNHYSHTASWTRETYDYCTADWRANEYATDCQGLLDAWLTYECGDKTDINANYNYVTWCTDKGSIDDMGLLPYEIGEALFMRSKSTGKMTHVGWICGFDRDGEPLVVEARSLRYGVMITRFEDRPWTHRGLMTKKFDYREDTKDMTKFALTSPMSKGDDYKAMQIALNAAGYTDANGNLLEEDGKWGKNSQAAFDKLIAAHAPASTEPAPEPEYSLPIVLTAHGVRVVVEKVDADA